MENECLADRKRQESLSDTPSQHSNWCWIYELRPPSASEALNCAAGGLTQARLIRAAENPESIFPDIALVRSLIACGDIETACAATIVGMNAVLEAGRDFNEFNTWLIETALLLANPALSPTGRGALLMQSAIAQLLGPCRLDEVLATLQALGDAAEQADSDAQRIVHASLRGYCAVMSGRLQIAEAIVRDALHISPDASSHLVAKMHLQASLGLINTLRCNMGDAHECLDALISHPDFDKLPSALWLLSMGHRLLSLAVANDKPNDLQAIAERIRSRSIPSHKHYHRSYTHYALGAAALIGGQPDTALFHAETAVEMGKRCHSRVAERTATLLAIQALADPGQRESALERLTANTVAWQQEGANLLVASGFIEEARLRLDLGQAEQARQALARAHDTLPAGAPLPCNLRRQEFVSTLETCLQPALSVVTKEQRDPRPIQITTFGELRVEINGKRLYDRDWRGTRTKTLLKALIVLGGYKISAERLCDMLWPDADGDVARNNLKVALWRLRHLGCDKGERALPWVVIQHGCVSLPTALCRVDCIEFEQEITATLLSGDNTRLRAALLPVTANFLATDDSATWIIQHREYLKTIYLRSSKILSEAALQHPSQGNPEPIVETACRLTMEDVTPNTYLTAGDVPTNKLL